MNNSGRRIDEIRRLYLAGSITESMARNISAPLIFSMNRKKIKREMSSGRDPKLFTFEQLIIKG